MDERPDRDAPGRQHPAVVCRSCAFAWHTARMAEGLRLLGSCPRCGGELEFPRAAEPAPREHDVPERVAPHLVLGLPRPSRR